MKTMLQVYVKLVSGDALEVQLPAAGCFVTEESLFLFAPGCAEGRFFLRDVKEFTVKVLEAAPPTPRPRLDQPSPRCRSLAEHGAFPKGRW